jgi:hypothetical protein
VMKAILDNDCLFTVHRGSFYECRGGYFRQDTSDESLILRSEKKRPTITREMFDTAYDEAWAMTAHADEFRRLLTQKLGLDQL